MALFANSVLAARQRKVAEAFDQITEPGDVVLVGCGQPITKPGGLDQTYPFLPHPEYLWLNGIRRPQGVMAYCHKQGWTSFVRPVDAAERLWEGSHEDPVGEDVQDLEKWVLKCSAKRLFLLGRFDFGEVSEDLISLTVENMPPEERRERKERIQTAIDGIRRRKDAAEIELIGKAIRATAAGFAKARELLKEGVTERQIQIEMEAEVFRAGAQKMGYETIVGSGIRSAVLHAPATNRRVGSNELVLIDAGGDIEDYCCDVTRVYSSSGRFTSEQQAIYDIVSEAQRVGIEKCQIGMEWHEVHRASARVIAEGLKGLKLLKGDTNQLLEDGSAALFFPHGVGHLVGLRVRDVGGQAPGRTPRKCCRVRVRVDLPLEEDFLVTVEPGLYFVQALLNDKDTRANFKHSVQWDLIEKWKEIGGVRIEDDVLVTQQGPRVLTSIIPK